MRYLFFILITISLFAVSCSKDKTKIEDETPEPDFTEHLIAIGTHQLEDGKTINIFSDREFLMGYNVIYVQILRDGKSIPGIPIELKTIMDMGDFKHSSPSANPRYDSDQYLYIGAAVFTMASMSDDAKDWSLVFQIDGREIEEKVHADIYHYKTVGSFNVSDERYEYTIYPDDGFEVGKNDFTLFVSKAETMMNYVPVDGLTIEFTPEMPSMGHGSPDNADPVDVGDGFYDGTVNLTMPGEWRLHFKIKNGDEVLTEDSFLDIEF